MKVRTAHLAARHDQLTLWSSDDLHTARTIANTAARPRGVPTPQQAFDARDPITPEARHSFIQTAVGHLHRLADDHHGTPLDRSTRRNLIRSAVERALVESGQLTLLRRSIPQPISPLK